MMKPRSTWRRLIGLLRGEEWTTLDDIAAVAGDPIEAALLMRDKRIYPAGERGTCRVFAGDLMYIASVNHWPCYRIYCDSDMPVRCVSLEGKDYTVNLGHVMVCLDHNDGKWLMDSELTWRALYDSWEADLCRLLHDRWGGNWIVSKVGLKAM